MSAIDTASDFIKAHEGLRLSAYKDQGGVVTIAWGHVGPDVRMGDVWDTAKCEAALKRDLQVALSAVQTLVRVPLTDKQSAALMSFVFNLGSGAFKNSTLLAKVNEKDWIGVAKEFIRWDHIGKEEVKGLLIRRLEEAALFLKGS